MDTTSCPRGGSSGEQWQRVVGLWSGGVEAHLRPRSAAGACFDRVMNWVVGILLAASVATLAFVQAHPPL